MKPNVKLVMKVDGKTVFEANLTALNREAVKMLIDSIDQSIDTATNTELPDDDKQTYDKALEYVEPNFSAFE